MQLRHNISLPRFHEYLAKKRVISHDWGVDTTGDEVIVTWEDLNTTLWAGVIPTFTAHYSAHSSIMTHLHASYKRNTGKRGMAFNAQVSRVLIDMVSPRVCLLLAL